MCVVFFIEGNIATGKSTVLELLKEHLPHCQIIKEPLNTWLHIKDEDGNILDHFYKTPQKVAYVFQSLAFFSRAKALKEIDYTKDFVFIERSVESDKLFAENCYKSNLLTTLEWKSYIIWFDWITEELLPLKHGTQKKHIYLRCNPETAYDRLQTRNREEEHNVSLSYLMDIHSKHELKFTKDRDDVVIFDSTVSRLDLTRKIIDFVCKSVG